MTFKDIQVHVDNDAACAGRVAMAVNLADRFDAHLNGVHVRRPFPYPEYSMVPTSASVLDAYDELLLEQEGKARAVFDHAQIKDNDKVGWRSLIGSANSLASEAHYADLMVLGQPDPKDPVSLHNGIADEIIISAGRPCLLIPYNGNTLSSCESPLIAWNGSREASRAVNDSLPFLINAGKATVLLIEPEHEHTDFGDLPGTMIAEHLARHNIEVNIEVSRGGLQSTSDTILTFADSYGHDLIIMGAYGHSRLREIVLGGATHDILKDMKVPVLMSH